MSNQDNTSGFGGFFKRHKHSVVLFLLLIIGFFVRCFLLGTIPPGLNQDEASIGYESFALGKHGVDRNGFHNPVHLVSWGNGQNALYAYLSMPFISMFGLNPFSVRLVNALLGCVSLVLFYLLIKKICNKEVALFSLFLLVISPWHIMMSRWALEANIFPPIFLLGVYFFVHSSEKQYFLPLSFFVFAVSLYSYGTSYFVVPVFLFISVIYLAVHKKISLNWFILSSVIFLVTAIPIILLFVVNRFQLESINTPWFSIPRFTDVPRYATLPAFFGSDFWANVSRNILVFLGWFVFAQHDGLLWNSIPIYGYMYLFSVPFMIFGIALAVVENKNLRVFNKSFFILAWFFVSLLMPILIDTNINRVNVIFPPAIFLISYGIAYLKNSALHFYRSLKILYLLFFISFLYSYFFVFPKQIAPYFFQSFGDAINYAAEKAGPSGRIYVTNEVNMPYIYVLFYQQIDPHLFRDTVTYYNTDGFGWVKTFGCYRFGIGGIDPQEGCVYVLYKTEDEPFKANGFQIKTFDDYRVAFK